MMIQARSAFLNEEFHLGKIVYMYDELSVKVLKVAVISASE